MIIVKIESRVRYNSDVVERRIFSNYIDFFLYTKIVVKVYKSLKKGKNKGVQSL